MKILRNRALSLFLAFVMTMSMIPGAAFAAGSDAASSDGEITILPDNASTAPEAPENEGTGAYGIDDDARALGDVYYVANSAFGGSDTDGDGSQAKPYLTINKAIATAPTGVDVNISLLSDIEATQSLVFTDTREISISAAAGSGYALAFTGTTPIGNTSGFIHVEQCKLSFTNITLVNRTNSVDARLLYAGTGSDILLDNVVFQNGKMNTSNFNQGGAGLYAASGSMVSVQASMFSGNTTNGGGGAVYVANGGDVTVLSGQFDGNTALDGGAIYVESQSGAGGLALTNGCIATSNKLTGGKGPVLYLESDSNVRVDGAIKLDVSNTDSANYYYGVYLRTGATLDMAGATPDSNILVVFEAPAAYTPVSFGQGYDITAADEQGWGVNDWANGLEIRYMVYNGVPGLYLYHKTLTVSFSNIDTLLTVVGPNINGETVDYMSQPYPVSGTTTESLTDGAGNPVTQLVLPRFVPAIEQDYVVTFTCDPDLYRIPTEDAIKIKGSGVQSVPFTYVPDFEAGTATITVPGADIKSIGGYGRLDFVISAEKYYDLTLRMDGPLYTMSSSVTGLSEKIAVLSESSKVGTEANYRVTRDDLGFAGVTVELYKEGDNSLAGSNVTDVDGRIKFTGLQADSSYYTILKYEDTYRVIQRDVVSLQLSALAGQTLDADAIATENMAAVVYDKSTGIATIGDVVKDGTVMFSVEQSTDTIAFNGNAGDATTAPVELSMDSKAMPANANTYGELATAILTGYTFAGWFTEADGGTEVTSATTYKTGVSPRILYAHWTANTDTAYNIQHWVELAVGGANARYIKDTTLTKTVDGVVYYLYDTTAYTDGVSDVVKDITGLGLTAMSDATLTWWTLDGFTPGFEADCKVLADGSSNFGVYYDRNSYTVSFQNNGMGTATNPTPIDDITVKFGALMGTLPVTTLAGYEFGGWHKLGLTALVTATDIFNQTEDMTLEAVWNTSKTAQWAIKIATQDIAQHSDGEYYVPGTYTDYKTVYLDNNGNALTGETDKDLAFAISSINALNITGFNYVGYASAYAVNGDNKTADKVNASVYVKPTTMLTTKPDGKYNEAFDGGIVWLYYDRKISDMSAEDGQGNEHEDEVIFGGDFTGHLPPDPGKDGNDFVDWVDKDGNVVDENTPADDYVTDGGTIELKPSWTARTYNLTYIPGANAKFVASPGTNESDIKKVAGGGYVDPNKVTYGKALGVMPTASKTGYNFVSWMVSGKAVNKDTVLDVANLVISNADKTPAYGYENTRPMTAAYKAHEYTLVLDPGQSAVTGTAGTVSPSEVRVVFDGKVSGLPIPKLTGYKFVAWQLSVSDMTSVVKNGDVWTRAYTDGARITLRATWIPETYRYTFDLNDSVGSTKASLVDTSIGYVEETFDSFYNGVFDVEAIRSGYTFGGWSLSKGGVPLTATDLNGIASDTTLYAVWTPVLYDVRLVMNGATIADLTDNNLDSYDPTASYDEATDTWTIKVAFDAVYGDLPVATKNDATYHGYLADAAGWPAKEGYGNTVHGQIIVKLSQYIDFVDVDGITLTLVMEPWFTFEPDGGTFDDGTTEDKKIIQSDITTLPVVTKPGYEFDGWVVDGKPDKIVTADGVTSMTEPTVLKPKFSALITFNANGGKANGKDIEIISTSKLTSLPGASKANFDFAGWFTDATNGTQTSLATLKAANAPITVYAHWTASSSGGGGSGGGSGGGGGGGGSVAAKEFTVKFESNGGTAVVVQTVKSGEKAVKPTDPTREFYVFRGWFSDKAFKTGFDFSAKITADTVLYADWTYAGADTYLTTEHIAYIAGFGDGTVRPGANITRAEVAMIFYRLLNDTTRDANKTSMSSFTDVDANAWYSIAVATLAKMNILNGRGNNMFDPNANITRAEFATIASRFDTISADKLQFIDVPSTHWAYAAIGSAAAKGWVVGYGDGNFGPENFISRAETVTLINRVLGRDKITVEGMLKNMMIDDTKSWSDNGNMTAWYYLAIQEAGNGHNHEVKDGQEIWTSLTDKTPGNQ